MQVRRRTPSQKFEVVPLPPPNLPPDFELRNSKFEVATPPSPPLPPPSHSCPRLRSSKLPLSPHILSRHPTSKFEVRSLKLTHHSPPTAKFQVCSCTTSSFEVRSLKISSKIAFTPEVRFLYPGSHCAKLEVQTSLQCYLCPCGEEPLSSCTSWFLSASFGIKGIRSWCVDFL